MAKKNKKSNQTRLKMARLAHGKGLPRPAYQSKEAAGLDLVAAVTFDKPIKLKPGERALIPTGLCLELPKGFEAQIRPRSGLALKHGVTVLNAPGTIDSDYRGEVQVILINLGTVTFTVRRGERIAQMVIAPVIQAKIRSSKKLAKTQRGTDGFGSTGSNTGKTKTKSVERKKTKTKPRSGSQPKPTRKSSKANPARRTSKTAPRIAAKSKKATPVKRKTASKAKSTSVRQTRRRTGSAATKSRARQRSPKK